MATNITPILINLPITADRTPSAVFSPVSIPKQPAAKKEGGSNIAQGLAKLISTYETTEQSSRTLNVPELQEKEGAQVVANLEKAVLEKLKSESGDNKSIRANHGRYYMSNNTYNELLQRARGADQHKVQIVTIPNIVQIKKAS